MALLLVHQRELYAPASGRGTITGQMVINDTFTIPNASAAGLWVGVDAVSPPRPRRCLRFSDMDEELSVLGEDGHERKLHHPQCHRHQRTTRLYAFGPGAAGTFHVAKSNSAAILRNTFNLPAPPFSVTVTGGATNSLGTVTWTPTRVWPTVFEIGYPSRTQNKFRHGDDYWVSEIYTNPAYPSPIWGMFLEYPFDFPNGPNYVVGQSRWTTDWNYVQPCLVSSIWVYNDSSANITFNLASAPSGPASFYLGLVLGLPGSD
jgi:hypothetical protein